MLEEAMSLSPVFMMRESSQSFLSFRSRVYRLSSSHALRVVDIAVNVRGRPGRGEGLGADQPYTRDLTTP